MSKGNISSGIGTLGLLGVAFVVLKLTDVIDSLWWTIQPWDNYVTHWKEI